MGLLDEQIAAVEAYYEQRKAVEILESAAGWPPGSDLVLKEDTAVELGTPQDGSLFFVLWSNNAAPTSSAARLLGPHLKDLRKRQTPFALAVTAFGEFEDEYEGYRQVMDAVYETKLDGVSVRVVPSRGSIWCRISKRALDNGFTMSRWAAALLENLNAFENIDVAQILFVTSGVEDIAPLRPVAEKTGRIIGAMTKMAEDMDCDCDSCEYESVCKDIDELKALRRRLVQEQSG